jgi:hypothetical protein
VTIFVTGTKLRALSVIHREKKSHQNDVLVIFIPESSNGNTNARRKVGNNLLLVLMHGRVCQVHTKLRGLSTKRQRGECLIPFIVDEIDLD